MIKKPQSHRRPVLILFLALLLVGFFVFLAYSNLFNPSPIPSVTLRLPVDSWPGNFWVLVADNKGYFKDEQIQAELVDVSDSYNESMSRVIDGSLDAYLMTFFDLIQLKLDGANLSAVFQTDVSTGGEGILARNEYHQLSDLRGKKIGVEVDSYLDYFLETSMLANGINPEDYSKIDILTDDLSGHYRNNGLDAMVIWEPDLSEIANQYGGNIVFDTSKIQGFSMNVFVFRNEFLKTRPGDVDRLLRVWKKASDFIQSNPDETLQIVSKFRFKIKPDSPYSIQEIQSLMSKDTPSTLADNLRGFNSSTGYESLYGNAQYALRFYQRRGALVAPSDVYNLIDRRFIKTLQTSNGIQ